MHDFTSDTARELMTLASKHKFVIMEDRYVGGEGGDEGCVGVRVVMKDVWG